jgi:hypothetical protein
MVRYRAVHGKDVDMQTSRNYRTALADALLDLLDFVDEKLREALDDCTSQLAAATEAGCAMPVIMDRLAEDDAIGLNFLLVLGTTLERQHWREWWDDFANSERDEFCRGAEDLRQRIEALRKVLLDKPD